MLFLFIGERCLNPDIDRRSTWNQEQVDELNRKNLRKGMGVFHMYLAGTLCNMTPFVELNGVELSHESVIGRMRRLFKTLVMPKNFELNISNRFFLVVQGEVKWMNHESKGLISSASELKTFKAGEFFFDENLVQELADRIEENHGSAYSVQQPRERMDLASVVCDLNLIRPTHQVTFTEQQRYSWIAAGNDTKITNFDTIDKQIDKNETICLVLTKEDILTYLPEMYTMLLPAIKERFVYAVDLLRKLTDQEKITIAEGCDIEIFNDDEPIVHQGDSSPNAKFYMIVSGAVKFTRETVDDVPDSLKQRMNSMNTLDREKTSSRLSMGSQRDRRASQYSQYSGGSNKKGKAKEIGKFFAGKSFGEGSAVMGLPRRASAHAVSNYGPGDYPKTMLLSLTREKLLKVFNQALKDDLEEKYFVRVLHGTVEAAAELSNDDVIASNKAKEVYLATDLEPLLFLGKGAFSTVLLVSHTVTGNTYALKCLYIEKKRRLQLQERLIREHRMLYGLSHPFILTLHASFSSADYIFSLYEVILGGEMTTIMEKHEKFPLDTTLFYVAQILAAVKYMHDKDIVHRDIKPENIMLTRNGYIKVTDFDTATFLRKKEIPHRHLERRAKMEARMKKMGGVPWKVYRSMIPSFDDTEARTYTFCGTPAYCSPEMLMCMGHGKPVDIWAVGVIFFQLYTGRKLF